MRRRNKLGKYRFFDAEKALHRICLSWMSGDHRFFFLENVDSFIANFRFTGNKVSEYVRIVRFLLILLACDRL